MRTNGFDKMKDKVLTFVKPQEFSELVQRVKARMCVDCDVRLRGRFDVCGGGRPHYVIVDLTSDDEWKLYRECLRESQIKVAEVVQEVVVGDVVADVVALQLSIEIDGVENLTQDRPCSPPELHSCCALLSSPFKEGLIVNHVVDDGPLTMVTSGKGSMAKKFCRTEQ